MKPTAGRPRLNPIAQGCITYVAVATMVGLALLHPRSISAQSTTSIASETAVVSKRAKGLVISIVTADGRLHGGKNSFCTVFHELARNEPIEVQDVRVDFAQQVGRMRERPISVRLVANRKGRYCGQVDLGNQFYAPSFYYAFVRYGATAGNRRERLFFSIR